MGQNQACQLLKREVGERSKPAGFSESACWMPLACSAIHNIYQNFWRKGISIIALLQIDDLTQYFKSDKNKSVGM